MVGEEVSNPTSDKDRPEFTDTEDGLESYSFRLAGGVSDCWFLDREGLPLLSANETKEYNLCTPAPGEKSRA